MPSCLSTRVKFGRRPYRCASRGVVAEETRNSPRGAGASNMRREERAARAMAARIAVASGQGRRTGGRESANTGREPCWWPPAANVLGHRRRQTEPAAAEKRGRTMARREETRSGSGAGRQTRTGAARDRGVVDRRALHRKDRADESWSTMKVDDDDDGGGDGCAAAGIVRRRRRANFVFAERGIEEDGLLDFILFWVATNQR
ncbi:hypothetical protein Scep_030443 [Stephania cephalantha]|uniref:Uncharacterized protein n=1 Tax=Stephania cephalantha TaxID=152367 RepID=A0AAP0E435_9MAGN